MDPIISQSDLDSYLAHYGVPGMKWGVRKARPVVQGKRIGKGLVRAQNRVNKAQARLNEIPSGSRFKKATYARRLNTAKNNLKMEARHRGKARLNYLLYGSTSEWFVGKGTKRGTANEKASMEYLNAYNKGQAVKYEKKK